MSLKYQGWVRSDACLTHQMPLFLLSFFYAEVLLCLKVTRTLTVSPLMNCAGETGDSQLSPYYHHPLEYSFRRAFLNFNLAWKNNTGRISLTINEVLHLALMQYQYKSTKNKKNPTEKPTFLMWQKETSTQIKLLLLQRRLIFWLNSNPAHAHRKAWKQQLLKSKQRNDMWDVNKSCCLPCDPLFYLPQVIYSSFISSPSLYMRSLHYIIYTPPL